MFELNEKYSDCPAAINEYEIEGKKYIVHSHFIGDKDINEVISRIAINRAMNEILTIAA